jgi:hypothetical protein
LGKKVAILQSNYIPWKGYFDLINTVDEFVLFDDTQYTKGDWRNRNIIKTKQGPQWLTIPVKQEKQSQLINETKISDTRWARKHWTTLSQNYSKAKYFERYRDQLESLYLALTNEYLSTINHRLITEVNKILSIGTRIRWSSEFDVLEGRTERLLSICEQCGASEYFSGPAAQSYFDIELAKRSNIKVNWLNYEDYPEYDQLHPPFDHRVSILDLIFNEGPNAKKFMKSFDNE